MTAQVSRHQKNLFTLSLCGYYTVSLIDFLHLLCMVHSIFLLKLSDQSHSTFSFTSLYHVTYAKKVNVSYAFQVRNPTMSIRFATYMALQLR